MAVVSDEAIHAHRGRVATLARRFVGRYGAEFDDLEQEGLILVWQSLTRGIFPSSDLIENRMRDWCRLLKRQSSLNAVSYEALLPLEDYGQAER